VVAVAAVVAVALLVWVAWDHGAALERLRRASPWAFFSAMAILPLIGAPVTPFFIIAGASFGARVGLVGSLIALTVNVAACYWIARSALRRVVESLLRRSRYALPKLTDKRKSARFTVGVKLAPGVPTFVKNYVLGVAGVPFLLYLGLSLLITGTYGASFVLLGQSFLKHNLRTTIPLVAFLVLLGGALWLIRRWIRRRRATDADALPV
jgi:uncharacterized membrane protein YdjX (TVP38/TMEM64 family)